MGLYRFFYLERLVGMGKIDKVINNNIIITHDDKEKEVILMGKAMGLKSMLGTHTIRRLWRRDIICPPRSPRIPTICFSF